MSIARAKTVLFMTNETELDPNVPLMYNRWQEWHLDSNMFPERFDGTVAHPLKFMINGTEYTEWSEEFQKEYNSAITWATLITKDLNIA